MNPQHIKAEFYRMYGRKWLSTVAEQLGVQRHVVDQVVKHQGLQSAAKRLRVAVELSEILESRAALGIERTFPEIAECVNKIAERKSCAA